MKLKEIGYLLGLRPKPKTFGYEITDFELPKDGLIQYAQWLHPKERKKNFSQEMVDELRKFLAAGDVALDIGAHSGDSTLPIALAVGATGCVLALEPNPYVFPVLQKNSALNTGKTKIVPLMFAAAPRDDWYEFEYSDAGFCNGGRHQGVSKWRHTHAFPLRVQGKNLEAFLSGEYPQLISKIRFIKVDAEGYDLAVMKSLAGLISKQRPYLMAEIYKWATMEQRVEFYRYLTDQKYAIYCIENSSHYRGERIDETNLMKWRHTDIFCVPEKLES